LDKLKIYPFEYKMVVEKVLQDGGLFKADVNTSFFEMQKDVSELKKEMHSVENRFLSSRFQQTISDLQSTVAGIHEALENEEHMRSTNDKSEADLREAGLRSLEERLESEKASLSELRLQMKDQLLREAELKAYSCEVATQTGPSFSEAATQSTTSFNDNRKECKAGVRRCPEASDDPFGREKAGSVTSHTSSRTEPLQRPARKPMQTPSSQQSHVRGAAPLQPPQSQSSNWGSDKSMMPGTANPRGGVSKPGCRSR